jgi:hypothetical protein
MDMLSNEYALNDFSLNNIPATGDCLALFQQVDKEEATLKVASPRRLMRLGINAVPGRDKGHSSPIQ